MANSNNGGQGGYGRGPRNYDNPQRQTVAKPVTKEDIPEQYVTIAEEVILGCVNDGSIGKITTTKLRKFFATFSEAYDEVCRTQDEKLTKEQQELITVARVRMVYECGRDRDVKAFIEKSKMISYLLSVGDSKAKFIRYYHYMEAIIAYHRFYGGKD